MSLLELSACGAVLILVGMLLRLRLPKDACMVVWWGAVLRLLIPVPLPAPWSVYSFLKTLAVRPEPVPAGPPVMVLPPVQTLPVLPALPDAPPVVNPEPFPFRTVLWAVGAVLLGTWFAVSFFRWRRRFRRASDADSPFLRLWAERHPFIRVRLSDQIDAPLTYGVFRPVILLPVSFPLDDEPALRCVLAHETVHIRRLDGLLKLLLAAALCVHWFNPAVWVLYSFANRDMELRCDQAALASLGSDSKALYALTLLRMAELRNQSVPFCSSFCVNGMEERIRAVMKFKKPSLLVLSLALAFALCVTAVFAANAWNPPADASSSPDGPDTGIIADSPDTADAMFLLRALQSSILFENGEIQFTIPDFPPEEVHHWNIWIAGRVLTAADDESGMIMSVHYLEEESERGEWVPGETYAFQTEDAAYDELTLTAAYGDEDISVDLTQFLPDNLAPLEVPELPESKENVPEDAEMVWPVDSTKINSGFGERANPGGNGVTVHNGVDIGAEKGAPVYAGVAGTVKDAGFDTKAGNYVLLDHGNGVETYYSSCQTILVKTGETVQQGQTIATVGQSGMSTGPHLHYEIRKYGESQDPTILTTFYPADMPTGEEPLLAETDGTVLYAYQPERDNFYTLVLNGSDGREYTYVSCRSLQVKRGDVVKAGSVLGTMDKCLMIKSVKANPAQQAEKAAELETLAKEWLVDGGYPRNKNGQTYAPNESLTAVVGVPPDLVGGIATNGLKGYIPLKELNAKMRVMWGTWKSPTDLDASETRSIPVYDEAGDVIGEFLIHAGNASSN